MIYDDPPPPPPPGIGTAIATTLLVTFVTGLSTWAIDELRERYGTAKRSPEKEGADK